MAETKNFLLTHCSVGLLTTVLSGVNISSIGTVFPVESITSDNKPLHEVMKVVYAIEKSGVRLQYRGDLTTFDKMIQVLCMPELKKIAQFWAVNTMYGNEPVFDMGSLDVPASLNRYVATPREDGYWQIEVFNEFNHEYEPIKKAVYSSQEFAETTAMELNNEITSDQHK